MFSTVLTQVIILFILIFLGFTLTKTKVFTENGIKSMTDLVLYFMTPCVMIKSFAREFSLQLLKNLVLSIGLTFLVHLIFILISKLVLRSKNAQRQNILQFGVIFSNCGFMAIPLLQALLGDDGVFYGAGYIAAFQVVIWSYGVYLTGGKKFITAKKMFLNPGVIGFVLALAVFCLSIPLPKVIFEPISYMASLNTPLPMLIIGYHLAQSNVLDGLKDIKLLFGCVLRLFILPIIAYFVFWLFGLRGTLPLALSICSSAPTGALITMFAAKFESDTSLSVTMVSLTTLLSVASMPVVITLAEALLK